MLTKNFLRLLMAHVFGTNKNMVSIDGETTGYYITASGLGKYVKTSDVATYCSPLPGTTSALGFAIQLGSGGSAETSDDYCLDSPLNDKYTTVSGVSSPQEDADTGTLLSVTAVIRNVLEEKITIKEVGLYYIYSDSYSNAVGHVHPALISRQVLKTPVELAAGEYYSFTINVVFN